MNRDDDFRPLDWVAQQIPRSEALQWWQTGFTLSEAVSWRERFGVEEAGQWRAAGIRTQSEARSWRIAGVSSDQVKEWLDAGIGFAEASAWHEFGYELAEAQRLKKEGKTPSESFRNRVQKMSSRPAGVRLKQGSSWAVSGNAVGGTHPAGRFFEKLKGSPQGARLIHGYAQRQWFDDDALAYAMEGIDAEAARVWKEFGIRPSDAAKAEKAGQTAAATIRAWWEAGVPPDEVGIWLGAGLTAQEAAEQRTQGVTPDRAAVLRALRGLDSL